MKKRTGGDLSNNFSEEMMIYSDWDKNMEKVASQYMGRDLMRRIHHFISNFATDPSVN